MHSAAIFAGGKSSRMGRDKALLPFGRYGSMAEFQYRKLLKYFDTVYISSKEEKFDFNAPIIKDLYTQSSPMVALYSVLQQLDEQELFILSVDMPNIGQNEIETLVHHYNKVEPKPEILLAQSPRGREPLCGIYNKSIIPHIKVLLQKDIHRLGALFELAKTEMVTFKNQESFANVNTPQEYQALIF